ncbi:MAG TPA: ACP phosphodiesterase [Dokdonella sp.]|uniref:acyl carrier protein phosphodiesterase n=1 Tax=Dokdonella sp. TaxID=2291710 RepID=UPI0025C0C55F|nr:ACP phosphodiesterase [Dokdonella sp.]MBX3691019.1 DUF479 domain-containing protein [Dokdonella sp.]MCW5568791.1 DUF479 domain-containing protein [Dokdonella sp.]HNR91744.1 ACP phosphodiesterase [Dokdonella sp.]
MNHLAHALLSGPDPELMLGGLMGDFVHGRVDPALPDGLRRGIALHRAIDSHTDAHPTLVALRERFEPPFRRYAGIVIDIWFDHLLARGFAHWSNEPLAAYSRRIHDVIDAAPVPLPERMRAFVRYMRAHGLPAAYTDRMLVARVFAGVSSRLRHANPLDRVMPEVERLEDALEESFLAFFPQLVEFAETWRAQTLPP